VKRAVWIFIFSFTLCKLSAGVDELTWYEGSVVLETREVLVGEISLEINHDLILFRVNNQVTLYPAHKIHQVRFYDIRSDINRKFISLSDNNGVVHEWHLYETVVRGEVNVLRREKSITTGSSHNDDFVYFVHYNNELSLLYSFRDKVYPAMVLQGGPQFESYVSDHKLNPNKSANAIEIVMYYNKFVKENQTLARN